MIYNCTIKMASHEWSATTNMEKIAREWFNSLSDEIDRKYSICTVHEHAGWYLSYGFISGQLTVVASANDRAHYPLTVHGWWTDRESLIKSGIREHLVRIDRPAEKIEAPVVTP